MTAALARAPSKEEDDLFDLQCTLIFKGYFVSSNPYVYQLLLSLISLYRNPTLERWATDRATSPVSPITVGSDHHVISSVQCGSIWVISSLEHLPEPSQSFAGRWSSPPFLRLLRHLHSPLHPPLATPPERAGITSIGELCTAHCHDGDLALPASPLRRLVSRGFDDGCSV